MSGAISQLPRLAGRPSLSEAVIADARRRARRRRIVTTAVAAALCAGGVAAYLSGGHPGFGGSLHAARESPAPNAAAACLVGHHALIASAQSGPQFLAAPAVHVLFALVPGRRHDGLTIFFERSRADARGVVGQLVARLQPKAPLRHPLPHGRADRSRPLGLATHLECVACRRSRLSLARRAVVAAGVPDDLPEVSIWVTGSTRSRSPTPDRAAGR